MYKYTHSSTRSKPLSYILSHTPSLSYTFAHSNSNTRSLSLSLFHTISSLTTKADLQTHKIKLAFKVSYLLFHKPSLSLIHIVHTTSNTHSLCVSLTHIFPLSLSLSLSLTNTHTPMSAYLRHGSFSTFYRMQQIYLLFKRRLETFCRTTFDRETIALILRQSYKQCKTVCRSHGLVCRYTNCAISCCVLIDQ